MEGMASDAVETTCPIVRIYLIGILRARGNPACWTLRLCYRLGARRCWALPNSPLDTRNDFVEDSYVLNEFVYRQSLG